MPAIRISVIWSEIEALFMVDRNIKKHNNDNVI